MQAGRTDAAGLEGVPNVAARAGPEILFARRPAAERTTYPGTGGFCVFVLARGDLGPGFRHDGSRGREGQTPPRSILRQRRGQRGDSGSEFVECSFQFAQCIRGIAEPAVPANGFKIERRPVRLSGSECSYTSFQAVSGKFQGCCVAVSDGLLDGIQHFGSMVEKKLGNFL